MSGYRRDRAGWGGWPWVVFVLISLVVLLGGLLVLSFVPGLGGLWPARRIIGGRGGICPWCGREVWEGVGPWQALLLCGAPLVFIGLVVVAILAWVRGRELPRRPRGGYRDYDTCARCGEPMHPEWSVCPHCGEPREEE